MASHAPLTSCPALGSLTWTMASLHFSHPVNEHLKHPLPARITHLQCLGWQLDVALPYGVSGAARPESVPGP